MKKICIVMYVFGDTYQEYIPLFLLSLFTVYPDYGVRIYLDRKLSKHVQVNMSLFGEYDVSIVEDYNDGLKLTPKARKFEQISKCVRWLVYDPVFEEYESIYIGDIDILFFPEKNPMFEEHMSHCEFLGKPFSNISRVHKVNKKIALKPVVRNFVKFGLMQSLRFYMGKETAVKKLSGLHFMKTKDYFPQMLELRDVYVEELNLLAEGKSKRFNLCSFNNEQMLYCMMLDCGFGDMAEAEPGYNLAEYGNTLSYRPHHGIHIGIFRRSGIMQSESDTINSPEYKAFYRYFTELKKTPEYKQIENSFSKYIKEIINNMCEYYRTNS